MPDVAALVDRVPRAEAVQPAVDPLRPVAAERAGSFAFIAFPITADKLERSHVFLFAQGPVTCTL